MISDQRIEPLISDQRIEPLISDQRIEPLISDQRIEPLVNEDIHDSHIESSCLLDLYANSSSPVNEHTCSIHTPPSPSPIGRPLDGYQVSLQSGKDEKEEEEEDDESFQDAESVVDKDIITVDSSMVPVDIFSIASKKEPLKSSNSSLKKGKWGTGHWRWLDRFVRRHGVEMGAAKFWERCQENHITRLPNLTIEEVRMRATAANKVLERRKANKKY